MPQTILLYGPSGVGKTSQLFRLCRFFLKKERIKNPNAKMRLIHADGGGYAPFEQSGWIEKGICDVFDIKYRENMLADTHRLSEGKWPIVDKNGEKIFTANDYEEDWSDYPVLAIEGFTSIGQSLIAHIADQESGVGFKSSYRVKEEEYSFGGLDKGHYGIIQKEISKYVNRGFNRIPCKYIIWTALRARAQDETTKETLIGPEVVGSALTHKISSFLGATFYFESAIKKTDNGELYYVKAHFERGVDKQLDMPFTAKCRIMVDAYPILKEHFPGGYVPMVAGVQGIEKYFEVEKEILEGMN